MIRSSTAPLALLTVLAFVAGCTDTKPVTAHVSGCAHVDEPKPRSGDTPKPTGRLNADKTNTVTFKTSCGDFVVTLDVKNAPNTTASVAALARSGFYDGTTFHRIVPGFVIQGGDPTASGSGGPGYKTIDQPPRDAAYTRGAVAMAKTATESPGTSGSQFFVVTAADAGLPPEYAVIGAVTKGMSTVKRIESLGTSSEKPSRPVVIEKATFTAK